MLKIDKFTFENKKLREQAFAIRHNVFVIGQNCPKHLEYENEESSTHFLLTFDGRAVATARHRKTKLGYKLERFAVLEKERGKGYGHEILKEILRDLVNFQGTIYMHAQVDVLPFYEKLGFKKIVNIFEEANIKHYKMILDKTKH